MKKVDMMNQVGISSSTVAKMTNGELVSMKVLEKICEKLDCDFGDIVHYERKPHGGCVHEQVAKADCEYPLIQYLQNLPLAASSRCMATKKRLEQGIA